MHHRFTEEQLMIKELAQRIAEEKIKPVRQKYDEEAIFPWDIVKELAQTDLFRVFIPVEYDGMVEEGLGITNMCIVTEELSKACGGIALAFAGSGLGAFPILLFGNEEQKKKYLPQIASGEKLAAFALTEPEAGSDAGAVRTTAKRDGDYYILNGNKIFITNGGEADIYTVIALTNPEKGARGASAFILEKGTPGFEFGKKEDKMGIRASATRELIFNDA
ncbi:MAG TPA: acyl-CoA dehydrogenase, partial [candidate division Zixibacteria bacterium]|nr:acyl-CoA dehydrogenase [candidate division Zixibacteria bacterium]